MAHRFDTCFACRALLEPGTPVCPYCQTVLRVRRRGAWGALIKFLDQAPLTYALFAAVVLLFGAELWISQPPGRGGPSLQVSTLSAARLGSNVHPLNVAEREWWRLVTALFLHGSFIHLFFNAWVLLDLVRLCERIYGVSRVWTVYLLSGVAGNVASLLWHGERFHNVGASGALCGLIGLMAVYGLGWRADPAAGAVRRAMGRWLLYIVLFGILVPAIDNAAHLGGAAAGAALGLGLARREARGRGWTRRVWRPAAAALVLVTLAAFGAMIASQGAWREAGRALTLGQSFERLQGALATDAARQGVADARAALRVAHADFVSVPVSGPLAAARDAVAEAAGRRLEGPPPPADVALLRAEARFAEAFAEAAHRHRVRIALIASDEERLPR